MMKNDISEEFKSFLKHIYNSESSYYPGHDFELYVKSVLDEYELTYQYQPNGTQKPPDFIVNVNDHDYINIECKSSKKEIPMWNSSIPEQDTLYFLSSEKHNNITISLGQHHLSKIEIDELELYKKEIKSYILNINTKLSNKFIKFYPRIAYQQIKSYVSNRTELFSKTIINLSNTLKLDT